ncbi:Crp/Fnr family transcriptional regulator [Deinococcus peraridilitoris]|uniref:cAMP-binding protein n=1 Tax=Deinococcus peraridilitoris (strain DSM 19664 / LMG 22246 / CIP 109416 / KR-200) TaxID=937777 RepID=L0A982_DEIPD|nr:Crp/Fnr family transcriptional regulator [Deinococcus peraridilitoris]AFZ69687.1 cAMP-binding protein [Deinococcus peraridilitoris DSM 19664]
MTSAWFVHDTELFQLLSDEDIRVLKEVCTYRTYHKGEALYRAGEEASALHIIVGGHVKLVTPSAGLQERVVAICGANDFIGELFVMSQARHHTDAIADSDRVVSCPISMEEYQQLAVRAPHFVVSFTQVLASHLAYCHDQLGLRSLPLKERVIHALVHEARRFSQVDDAGWARLERQLTHEELASRVNAARVSVSEVMAELRAAGMLRGHRGRYELNIPALEQAAEGRGARLVFAPQRE